MGEFYQAFGESVGALVVLVSVICGILIMLHAHTDKPWQPALRFLGWIGRCIFAFIWFFAITAPLFLAGKALGIKKATPKKKKKKKKKT